MNLETFFEKFDQFADAPDAVAKMRELVLDLAVQGKLAEQIPAEGGGHALLRQVHKKNPPSAVETDEEPVDSQMTSFPPSWALSKLGDVAHIIRGVTFPGSAKSNTRADGDVACLRTASVQAEIDWDDLIYISPAHVSRTDQWVAPNDIMISMANSYALVGKVAMVRQVPQKATFGAFLAAIRPVLIEPYFLLYVLRSPRMQAAFRASSSQTTNIANISLGRMRPLPFPLPPLAEQKQIVAKVDELMALCDRLEAQQQERETRHAALARASLARFADAPTPANLHFLFHPSYAISPADLRKSILTLAVQGKLVPQDPNDEPAAQLLRRIDAAPKRAMRTRATEEGEGAEPPELEPLFELPLGWEWARFGRLPLQASVGLDRGRSMQGPDKAVGYFKMNNIRNSGGVDFSELTRINATPDEIEAFALTDGDFLFNTRNSRELVGKTCVFRAPSDDPILYNNNILRVKFIEGFSPVFLDYWFRSPEGSAELEKLKSNTTNVCAIYQGKLSGLPCVVPPLAEQRRIVAKVEQLMALVDALELQLATSRATAEKLLAAVVAELTEGTHASPAC